MTAPRALEACYEHITVDEEVSWISSSSPDWESPGEIVDRVEHLPL